jgi:hypothetical protein
MLRWALACVVCYLEDGDSRPEEGVEVLPVADAVGCIRHNLGAGALPAPVGQAAELTTE